MAANSMTYPPGARIDRRDDPEELEKNFIVQIQPAASPTMTTARGGEGGNAAMRLRGGCCCPVRL